ncbi:hypothetical protein AAA799B03_00768 [Marine Group I thaumarchaeote SCGC AAA799-B03]|uniref:Uncharacterized protein n=1 Tax=Marine Group I thaumarchaeote SCGC AAA799-B03 TaxID=1502289 RepID=A0A087S7G4_9ARCH|nr:hypothetical protein AAA799B03_00768 [Marine Group I thaumarchaeote SCGC AAA799-B03]
MVLKLTNELPNVKQKCDECTGFLKQSNWRNENVFLKTKNEYLCIRCIRDLVTDRKLDNFVKKQHNGIIPEIPTPSYFSPKPKTRKVQFYSNRKTRLTTRCMRKQHTECKSVMINCTCFCHGITQGEKK